MANNKNHLRLSLKQWKPIQQTIPAHLKQPMTSTFSLFLGQENFVRKTVVFACGMQIGTERVQPFMDFGHREVLKIILIVLGIKGIKTAWKMHLLLIIVC